MNFFNINFWPPPKTPDFGPPEKKFMCLISWERTQKRNTHKFFRGDFWGQKGGPKRAIFGHKKFSDCFLFALKKRYNKRLNEVEDLVSGQNSNHCLETSVCIRQEKGAQTQTFVSGYLRVGWVSSMFF